VPSLRRLAHLLIGIAVSAALLVWVFWNTDLRAIAARLRETDWTWLLASIGCAYGSLWARARRWYHLFPPRARPPRLFNAIMILYMGNNILPLRAGELLRVYVVARRGQAVWTVVATVVVERVLDGLAVCLILAGVFLTLPVSREVRWATLALLVADLVLIVLVGLVAVVPVFCRDLVRTLFRWLGPAESPGDPSGSRWRHAVEDRVLRAIDTVHRGLEAIRSPWAAMPILLWSVAVWVLIVLSFWLGMWAAHLDLPMSAAWTVIAFTGLGVSLPSSPGFVGVIQAAAVLALALFGVSRTDALSFSLLIHASQFVPVTVHGLILLAVEHVSLADARRQAPASAVPEPARTRPG
jgi:glycosyltransferase 2 family protein